MCVREKEREILRMVEGETEKTKCGADNSDIESDVLGYTSKRET